MVMSEAMLRLVDAVRRLERGTEIETARSSLKPKSHIVVQEAVVHGFGTDLSNTRELVKEFSMPSA